MTLLSPHPRSVAAAWLRQVSAWLALLLLAQGLQAALAHVVGPLHTHLEAAHEWHAHGGMERHRHEHDMPTMQLDPADEAVATLAQAMAAALALLACGARALRADDALAHVLRNPPLRHWRSVCTWPLRRPPRPA